MSPSKIRERFMAAAIALAARGQERFVLNELYIEAKLTRADFRQTFGSKAALMRTIAAAPAASRQNTGAKRGSSKSTSENSWNERRFRIIERALSSLENQIANLKDEITAPSGGSKAHFAQLNPPTPTATDNSPTRSFESPPFTTIRGEAAKTPTSADTGVDNMEALTEPTEDFDNYGSESYWSIAKEQLDTHPYKVYLVFLIAILCGAFVGVLLSTAHASSHISASAVSSPSRENKESQPVKRESLYDRANRGDAFAQRQLALANLKGLGMPKNIGNAMHWATVAASNGDADAAYLLGYLYQSGMLPDLQSAAHWYFEGAKRGNPKAMHNLGIALLNGLGVNKDGASAALWFQRAANLGYRDSEFNLGVLYERGQGVEQDATQALKWYEKAASAGDIEARKRAAWLEENTTGLSDPK